MNPPLDDSHDDDRIAPGQVDEVALFLVRVFGEEARAVAAERARHSEQKAEWALVAAQVARLLADGAPPARLI